MIFKHSISLNKVLLLILIILNLSNIIIYEKIRKSKLLYCYFFNIGQGDSALVQYLGVNILIDGGDNTKGEKGHGLNGLLSRLKVNKIDIMILSHPHADHIYGLVQVLKKMKVSQIILPQEKHGTELFKKFEKTYTGKKIPFLYAYEGTKIEIGNKLLLNILSPPVNKIFNDLDNNSVVIKLLFENKSILFTGDIFFEAEKRLCENYGKTLKSDILKIPHHGSKNSSSHIFLKHVNPAICIISCGEKNKFGFPNPEALKRISRACKRIYRTDTYGSIRLIIHNNGYDIGKF